MILSAHRFLSIDLHDHFLWKVARDVATARDNEVVPTRFSIGTSASSGFHWVSVFYSIEKKEEDHGTQPGTEEVHTPTASSQRRLNRSFRHPLISGMKYRYMYIIHFAPVPAGTCLATFYLVPVPP